jgi:hypothetical protein
MAPLRLRYSSAPAVFFGGARRLERTATCLRLAQAFDVSVFVNVDYGEDDEDADGDDGAMVACGDWGAGRWALGSVG